jgi:hypothetical protein
MPWINTRQILKDGLGPRGHRVTKEKGELYDPSGMGQFTYNGRTMGLREWAKERVCKVSERSLRSRIQHGWSIRKALTTPQLDHHGKPVNG